MMRTECDNCRALGDCPPPPGWIAASVVEEPASEPSFVAAITGHGGTRADTEGIFCSWRCLADYAMAKALIAGAQDQEPSP